MSITEFKPFKLELQPLADWGATTNPKDNGKHVWTILSARPLSQARQLSTYHHVIEMWLVTWFEHVSPLQHSPPAPKLQTYNNLKWKN